MFLFSKKRIVHVCIYVLIVMFLWFLQNIMNMMYYVIVMTFNFCVTYIWLFTVSSGAVWPGLWPPRPCPGHHRKCPPGLGISAVPDSIWSPIHSWSPASSISLDRGPASSISLDRGPASSISLDRGPAPNSSLSPIRIAWVAYYKIFLIFYFLGILSLTNPHTQ